GEDQACGRHQDRADDERPASPDSIGVGRQPQADQRVADQRQGEEDADLTGIEPGRGEVEDEDDPEGAVAGHPDGPRGEQQPRVPGHRPSVGWPRWPKPTRTIPMPANRWSGRTARRTIMGRTTVTTITRTRAWSSARSTASRGRWAVSGSCS